MKSPVRSWTTASSRTGRTCLFFLRFLSVVRCITRPRSLRSVYCETMKLFLVTSHIFGSTKASFTQFAVRFFRSALPCVYPTVSLDSQICFRICQMKSYMMSSSVREYLDNSTLISCNVYVSAGKPWHRDLLCGLLKEAQKDCVHANSMCDDIIHANSYRRKRVQNSNSLSTPKSPSSPEGAVVVVHAFSDSSYDRSSYHIAGSPVQVETVASNLILRAIRRLTEFDEKDRVCETSNDSDNAFSTPHPTVGLVDHVSVLPLFECKKTVNRSSTIDTIPASQPPITGHVARSIGNVMMQQCGIDVLYYGYADPDNTPLAVVRRNRTNFFKSSRSTDGSISSHNDVASVVNNSSMTHGGQATVGAPQYFTENYNIRLHPHIDKKQAQTLTNFVRERSGGLKFVEALTLPYNRNKKGGLLQYEVACNLLNPNVSSTRDIDERVKKWTEEIIQKEQFNIGSNKKNTSSSHGDKEPLSSLIEKSYRVGTTIEMCRYALEQTKSKDAEEKYNNNVFDNLKGYLSESEQ